MTRRAAAHSGPGSPSAPDRWRSIDRARLSRPSTEVAPDLLGLILHLPDEDTAVRILETEAYAEHDPACHAHRGRTDANAGLFGPPGHLYVYFTYGMHHCANIVTGREGDGEGVLLRAAAPLRGATRMRERRRSSAGRAPTDRDLLRGPGRLAQALGLDRDDDGIALTGGSGDPGRRLVRLVDDGWRPGRISSGPRVGVRLAADLPWRWWVADDPRVSDYRRHPKAD